MAPCAKAACGVSPRARGSIADTAGQYCPRLPLWHPACAAFRGNPVYLV